MAFFEVHAENYMGAGGPPHRHLAAIRDRYPLSLHGVGLSIGGILPLDASHLRRLRELMDRYAPAAFSEHLAWSTHGEVFLSDLLPIPYTTRTLARVSDHVDQVQDALGCRMLLENPSTYASFAESSYSEAGFIGEVVRRTGCGLLLDVNNVHVASTNHESDPYAYIDALPLSAVAEVHLAGHAARRDEHGRPLLIDTHDRPVDGIVWDLYAHALARTGPVPTLIEWDEHVPEWATLLGQARRADALLRVSDADAGPTALSWSSVTIAPGFGCAAGGP